MAVCSGLTQIPLHLEYLFWQGEWHEAGPEGCHNSKERHYENRDCQQHDSKTQD